jgi:hypothetical protein
MQILVDIVHFREPAVKERDFVFGRTPISKEIDIRIKKLSEMAERDFIATQEKRKGFEIQMERESRLHEHYLNIAKNRNIQRSTSAKKNKRSVSFTENLNENKAENQNMVHNNFNQEKQYQRTSQIPQKYNISNQR